MSAVMAMRSSCSVSPFELPAARFGFDRLGRECALQGDGDLGTGYYLRPADGVAHKCWQD
jgi:hypothetical protein